MSVSRVHRGNGTENGGGRSDERGARPGDVRILYLIGDLTTGGSERHLCSLLDALGPGFECRLAVLQARGPLLEAVERAGVGVEEIGAGNGPTSLGRTGLRFRAAARRFRPHVVHAYGYPCDVLAAAFSPLGEFKVVTSRRGNEAVARRRWLYRLTDPLVDRVACVSRATAEFARRTEGLRSSKTVVIPNGIRLESPPRETGSRPVRVIGTVGRLRHVKGTDLLVDAFLALGDCGLELRIGGPADSAWGEQLRSRYERTPGIRFVGEVSDTAAFLRDLDLFVLPSRSEGMSNALLEAMAATLPIVATDVGSNREVLDDGRCGVLVAPESAAILRAIERVLREPEATAAAARRAAERVRREYSLDTMVRRYRDFYRGLAAPGARESGEDAS